MRNIPFIEGPMQLGYVLRCQGVNTHGKEIKIFTNKSKHISPK